MALGAGKYDALTTQVREQTHARGVILLVFDGDEGSGFSCQTDAIVLARLPAILEDIAKEIRESR